MAKLSDGIGRQPGLDGDSKSSLDNLRKCWKKCKEVFNNDKKNSPIKDKAPTPDPERDERLMPGWGFVADDLEGIMVVLTMCLECETVTEEAKAVCELCVPVGADKTGNELFRAACLSSEYLRDQNKYWCECCLRYNEAWRSVSFSRLPRLLMLQLSLFSGGMEKTTRHVPTPQAMPCLCEPCSRCAPDQPPQHRYVLWAVIMHQGQTLTGGNYVAYARDIHVGSRCERTGVGCGASGFMQALFSRPRPPPACAATDCCLCCLPRPRREPCGLPCDDELFKLVTDEEFEDLLSAEPKARTAATPYLIFYVKSEVG